MIASFAVAASAGDARASKTSAAKSATAQPAATPPLQPAPTSAQATAAQATAAQATAAADAAAVAEAAKVRQAAIDTARARCTAILKTIQAVAIQRDPIEDGECGALAPVELISVGKNPEVALSPPAVVTCDLAVAIHDWMKADVQPLARTHLGKPVIRIETMSSYSCRHAYGRTKGKLSEHGRANAVDIRGFVTTAGETAYVLSDWGMTSGEIKAAAAAAEKEQAERERAKAAATAVAQAKADDGKAKAATTNGASTQPTNPLAHAGTIMDGLPKPTLSIGGAASKSGSTGLGLAQPSHLGGPKKANEAPPAPVPHAAYVAATTGTDAAATARSLFLRQVHESACRRFGTTLGPESNQAHRNHFHIDLAERKTKLICE
jgi:hypothetical protein